MTINNKTPKVISLNISQGGIPKWPVTCVRIYKEGLDGDGHNHAKHYRPEQAVSLQDVEKLAELRREGYALECGTTGENVNVGGLNINGLMPGATLTFSGGVQIQITKVRQPCYVLDDIDPKLKEAILGRCGMYARVLVEGVLRIGETIEVYYPQEIIRPPLPVSQFSL